MDINDTIKSEKSDYLSFNLDDEMYNIGSDNSSVIYLSEASMAGSEDGNDDGMDLKSTIVDIASSGDEKAENSCEIIVEEEVVIVQKQKKPDSTVTKVDKSTQTVDSDFLLDTTVVQHPPQASKASAIHHQEKRPSTKDTQSKSSKGKEKASKSSKRISPIRFEDDECIYKDTARTKRHRNHRTHPYKRNKHDRRNDYNHSSKYDRYDNSKVNRYDNYYSVNRYNNNYDVNRYNNNYAVNRYNNYNTNRENNYQIYNNTWNQNYREKLFTRSFKDRVFTGFLSLVDDVLKYDYSRFGYKNYLSIKSMVTRHGY